MAASSPAASASSGCTMSAPTRASATRSSPTAPTRCPAAVLVCSDSHTCASGAFNCAARGIGAPDLIAALTTGKTWFRVGETIRYDLHGALRPGVSAKDLFLHLAGTYGHHTNQNVEFGGPGLANLEHRRAPHDRDDGRRALRRVRHLRVRRPC